MVVLQHAAIDHQRAVRHKHRGATRLRLPVLPVLPHRVVVVVPRAHRRCVVCQPTLHHMQLPAPPPTPPPPPQQVLGAGCGGCTAGACRMLCACGAGVSWCGLPPPGARRRHAVHERHGGRGEGRTWAVGTCGWKRTAAPPLPSVALACSSCRLRNTTRDIAQPRTHNNRVASLPSSTQRPSSSPVHCPTTVSMRSAGRSTSSSLSHVARRLAPEL